LRTHLCGTAGKALKLCKAVHRSILSLLIPGWEPCFIMAAREVEASRPDYDLGIVSPTTLRWCNMEIGTCPNLPESRVAMLAPARLNTSNRWRHQPAALDSAIEAVTMAVIR
jgi:hypothetical protein